MSDDHTLTPAEQLAVLQAMTTDLPHRRRTWDQIQREDHYEAIAEERAWEERHGGGEADAQAAERDYERWLDRIGGSA